MAPDENGGEHVELSQEIGDRLRRVRLSRGLTLRAAAAASAGRFKPSSIAGYERGERAITVQRFCDLAGVYRTDPARLLDGVVRAGRREPAVEVDVEALATSEEADVATVRSLVRHVVDLRDEPEEEVMTLRRADIEVLAAASGRPPNELLALISESRGARSED